MNIFNANNNDLMFCGDIHGEFKSFVHKLVQLNIDNINIIVCGDIGIGFYSINYYHNLFKQLNPRLKKRNIHLYCFRGNHDDPEYFNNNIVKTEVLMKITNIHLMDDYDILKNDNFSILVIGGAISIDRKNRWKWDHKTQKQVPCGYWENEVIKDIPENFIDELYEKGIANIDIICSHSAPIFCPPFTKNNLDIFAKYDESLLDDLDNERKLLEKIYNKLIYHFPLIKYYIYGHFHHSYFIEINGVKFYGLNKFDECYSLDHKIIYKDSE